MGYSRDQEGRWVRIPSTASPDGRTRQTAAQVLGQRNDMTAIEPLLLALNDEIIGVRISAADALDALGWQPDQGTAGIAYWITRKQWDRCIQIGPTAVESLVAELIRLSRLIGTSERNQQERSDVANALKKLGWKPDKGEKGAAYWIATKKWKHCLKIGEPAVELLIDALRDDDEAVVENVASILGQMGDSRAVLPLVDILKNKKRAVNIRKNAAVSLGQIGDSRAVKPLIDMVKDMWRDVNIAAFEALVQIGDIRAVEPLILMLKDPYFNTRSKAAEVLVSMYQSGKLDNENQRLILAQKETITKPRVTEMKRINREETKYFDGRALDCVHEDTSVHHDEGIGVDFPV